MYNVNAAGIFLLQCGKNEMSGTITLEINEKKPPGNLGLK
jgi:hypothetical protein